MFVVILKFAQNRDKAGALMAGHNAWIDKGFKDGLFLLSGSLAGKSGGAVLAHGATRAVVESRVAEDPFVAEGVVSAEIIEILPSRLSDPLSFMAAQ